MDEAQLEAFKNLFQGWLAEGAGQLDLKTEAGGDEIDTVQQETALHMEMRLQARNHVFLKKVRHALERIEDGTFNECDECGDEIAEARLRALPFAVRCKEGASMMTLLKALRLDQFAALTDVVQTLAPFGLDGLDRTQHCRLHGRGDDDRFHTIGITQATQEFHAVHAGHIEIAQRQIAAGGVIEQADRSMTISRLQYLLRAHALQQYHRQTAGNRIILQYQHPIQYMPHAANDS
jgi:DnaK suppressor protein